MFNRRGFIKRGALFLPMLYIPQFGDKVCVELFNKTGSEVFWVHRDGGLQAASTIKERTFSSIVDRRIKLTNSNFARLWSTDVGTTWTAIRVACRISMEDTGSSLTSTPRFPIGICSGTSNIFMDATTTHWMGSISNAAGWARSTSPVRYDLNDGVTNSFFASKRIGSALTVGSLIQGGNCQWKEVSLGIRSVYILQITKGSPNFTLVNMINNATADVSLDTYLSQLSLSTPAFTSHTWGGSTTIAIDEATNGYFNAINIAWDRTSPAIEISDLAVVKMS